jgi:hypothetical protein
MHNPIPNACHINISALLLVDDLMTVFLVFVLPGIKIMA